VARKAKTKRTNRATAVRKSPEADVSLRKHLVELLQGGEAHVGMSDALADFPAEKRAVYANGLEHTAWQLLEHIRLAQSDILEFSPRPQACLARFSRWLLAENSRPA